MRHGIGTLPLPAGRSDIRARPVAAAGPARRAAPASCYRGTLMAAVLLSATLAYLATPAAESARAVHAAGPELAGLLRLTALVKLAVATAALGLVGWRLGFPVRAGLAWAYVAGCTAMAAGPGLVWGVAHALLGATLLHGGLLFLLLLGWADGGFGLSRVHRPHPPEDRA